MRYADDESYYRDDDVYQEDESYYRDEKDRDEDEDDDRDVRRERERERGYPKSSAKTKKSQNRETIRKPQEGTKR